MLPHAIKYLAESHVFPFEGGAIRRIENQRVHACIGKHLSVLPQHPGIGVIVITQQRWPPVMRGVERAPQRRLGFVLSVWVDCEDFGYIVNVRPVSVIQEIENPHLPIWTGRLDLRGQRKRPLQGVRGWPRDTGVGTERGLRLLLRCGDTRK